GPFGQSEFKQQYYELNKALKISPNAHLDEWQYIGAHTKILTPDSSPVYQVTMDYQRKSGFYLYKIMLPLLVIIGIAYTVIWLPLQPAINRVAVVMTSMLTVVAFQWVIGKDMPMVSYITYLQ